MNKEDILKISQKENKGKPDERELEAFGKASRIGMLVGAFICVLFVIIGSIVLNEPVLIFVGWIVYFGMQGSSNIVLYKYFKKRYKLIYGILEIVLAIAFVITLLFRIMV